MAASSTTEASNFRSRISHLCPSFVDIAMRPLNMWLRFRAEDGRQMHLFQTNPNGRSRLLVVELLGDIRAEQSTTKTLSVNEYVTLFCRKELRPCALASL